MNHCPRCRAACGGDAYCSWCGLPMAGPTTTATPGAVPGAVLTVQILLGLGVAVTVLIVVLALSLYSMVGTAVSELGPLPSDPALDAQMSYAHGMMIFGVVVALAGAAVSVWAIVALNRASRAGRAVVIAMPPVFTTLSGLVSSADPSLTGTGAGGVVIVGMLLFALPGTALYLVLLWAVPSSRRFFDHGRAPAALATIALTRWSPPKPPMPPIPAPRPVGRGPVARVGAFAPAPDDAARTDVLVVPTHLLPPAGSGAPR